MSGRHRSSRARSKDAAVGGGAVLGVVLVAIVVAMAAHGGDGGDEQVTAGTGPAGSTPSSAATAFTSSPPATTPAPTGTATATPTDTSTRTAKSPTPTKSPRAATVRIAVTKSASYLVVQVRGGPTLVSGTVGKGYDRSFYQRRLDLVVGNSAAVRVTVNGRPRPAGAVGEVDRLTVTRDRLH